MKTRPNILYMCTSDPDVHSDGAHVRTQLLYKALCQVGRTYVLCNDQKMREVPGERMRMSYARPGRIRWFADWLLWVGNSYLLDGCPKLLPFRLKLNVKEAFPDVAFDFVVTRYPHLGGVASPWQYGKFFIDFDDHPLGIYETMHAPHQCAARRWLSRKVFRWVIGRIARRCAGIWVSNPANVGDFPSGTRAQTLENIPREVSDEYDPSVSRDSYLLTVGHMAWEPNRYGVETFLSDIWPTVRAQHPELTLRIAGGGLPAEVRERWERVPGVACLGFVDDLDGQYAHALATVVPVDCGSGTCIKTRDALAHSRICLSTPFGARGIATDDLRDGAAGILVYRTADEFLLHLKAVLDEETRAELERRAFAYAQRKLTFSNFVSQVEQVLTGRAE